MELAEAGNWILSALELDLCVRMLNPERNIPLPIVQTTAPLDQRMLDAFLHLAELGLVSVSETGYRPNCLMRTRLCFVADPDFIVTLTASNAQISFCIGSVGLVLMKSLDADLQRCHVEFHGRGDLERTLYSHLENWNGKAIRLELRGPSGTVLWLEDSPAARRNPEQDMAMLGRLKEGLRLFQFDGLVSADENRYGRSLEV